MALAAAKKTFGIVQIKKRHVITLGQEVRKELNLDEGDILDVSVEDGKIVLEPKKLIPADQQWFWTEEWQAAEREAQADIDAGRVKQFDSMEEFLDDLRKSDEGSKHSPL
ncbi:SpoVT / AbrB like domain protein [Peptococcaceae bacterium CEB3]|nr:SpoVT / AbrB like domain protein [Peptococcaceae bacterium CEB3]